MSRAAIADGSTGRTAGERTSSIRALRPSAIGKVRLGVAPVLALVAAAGLLMIAYGNNAARDGAESAGPLFWGGLVLIYGPIAFRLLSAGASRAERVALAILLGVSLCVVKVLASPAEFVRYDELGTWRATNDVLQSGHLLADNPLVVSTAGFPGLEAVTAALAELAGLSIFHAGLIVIGVARASLMLALFLFLERVTRSPRAAGIGVAVYACNPSFLYFDAQFGYESLALALAAALLLLTLRWNEIGGIERPGGRSVAITMLLLVSALTVTHHMTSVALFVFLLVWAGLIARGDRPLRLGRGAPAHGREATPPPFLAGPGFPALMLGVTMTLWFGFVAGSVTIEELGGVFSGLADSTLDLIAGDDGRKAFFQGGGASNPLILRALAFASVIPLLALLPIGIPRAWRGPGSSPLSRALAIVALTYPITLGLRLTQAGSETSQRASEFAFLGVTFLAAIVVGRLRWPQGQWRGTGVAGGLTVLATVIFLGGVVIGELPATRQPGPFLVGAEARSLGPQGRSAAEFAARELPAGSRIIVDRSNAMLLGSYGDVNPVLGQIHGIPVPRVLFSERFGRAERVVIRDQFIDYVVVDRRLSRDLPAVGFYVESDEPGAYTRETPISRRSLTKFEDVRSLDKIFDDGPIAIYDASRLRPESTLPGAP